MLYCRLRGNKGLAQLSECVAARERCNEQAIGSQCPPDLHQDAREIVDELQCESGDDKIKPNSCPNGRASSSAASARTPAFGESASSAR